MHFRLGRTWRRGDNVAETFERPVPACYREHVTRHSIRVAHTGAAGQVYDDVLAIRGEVYGLAPEKRPEPSDAHSELYCAYWEGRPVGTIRTTRSVQGPLDCEEHFPPGLVADLRPQLCSSSRLCMLRDVPTGLNIPRLLIEVQFLHVVQELGVRLDLIAVHQRALRYYTRLGYCVLGDSFFLHPFRNAPCHVMGFPVDARRLNPLSHLYKDIKDPLSIETLQRYARIISVEDARSEQRSPGAASIRTDDSTDVPSQIRDERTTRPQESA